MCKFTRLVLLLTATLPISAYAVGGYTVDPGRSNVHFGIGHFWFTTHGRFDKISGKITLDMAAKKGAVDISIEAASINTGIGLRDKNLRSPNFFDVAKFPNVIYQSSALIFTGDTPVSIQGNLTLLGVSKPVTLTVTAFKCGLQPANQKEVCNAAASTRIKRSDFGMVYAIPLVGDEIELAFEVKATKD